MGYRVSIGRQAYSCSGVVWATKDRPNSHRPRPTPRTWARLPARKKRTPPRAMLFIAIIPRVVASGSGLKCMAATQNPPSKESTSRLRYSARNGTRDQRAH